MSDRNEWIKRRTQDGYDWSKLLLALSELKVYGGEDGHGLIVNMSAIAPEFYPTAAVLEPGPDGWWSHGPSGVAGPLFEVLCSITLSCLEAGSPYKPTGDDEPEEDADNLDYMRGWQDAKTDSVDPRSKRPCPGCSKGDAPVLLDEDGTLSSLSGNPGRPGHGADDAYWFCEDFLSIEPQGEGMLGAISEQLPEALRLVAAVMDREPENLPDTLKGLRPGFFFQQATAIQSAFAWPSETKVL